jgi:ribosomal protein S18 acetylase RimI-like enzyme
VVLDVRFVPPGDPAGAAAVDLLSRTLGAYVRHVNLDGGDSSLLASVDGAGEVTGAVISLLVRGERVEAWADYLQRQSTKVVSGSLAPLVHELRDRAQGGLPVGDLHAIGVAPGARGAGTASALVTRATEHLVGIGVDLAVSEAWHNPDAPDARGVPSRCGYEPVAVVRQFWLEHGEELDDPQRDGCAHCGAVCTCDATVCVWRGGTLPARS